MEKELPGPEVGEDVEAYTRRANKFYKEQMLKGLGKEHRIRQLEKEMEETFRRRHESQIKEMLKEIGSIQNARHGIQYWDSLQKAIEWKRESNPELAASVEQLITNLQQGYEKSLREERESERTGFKTCCHHIHS